MDISLLPSLARHDDVTTLTQGYGDVVVDECHHLGGAAYEHSVKRIAAQFWLGLTATPTRRDGLGQLVDWQLGPVRHTLTDEAQGTLAATMHSDAGPDERCSSTRPHSSPATCTWTRPARSPEVHRRLAVDEARNAQIADDVVAALTRGRNCLVLTRRVAHVEALTALFSARGHQALVLQGTMNTTNRRAVVDRLDQAKICSFDSNG
ncbi:DEAD/DEAH box helicase [Micromonospora sp. NPDC003776]